MIAATPRLERMSLDPACLGAEEVAYVLTGLRRASESLRVAEGAAARHANVGNNVVGLSAVLQLVIAEVEAVYGVVERASLRA